MPEPVLSKVEAGERPVPPLRRSAGERACPEPAEGGLGGEVLPPLILSLSKESGPVASRTEVSKDLS